MTNKKLVFLGLIALLFAAVVVHGAYAGDIPDDVEVFALRNTGRICVVFPDGSGDCYCPCEANCATILPSDTPVPTEETPEPRDTPTKEPTLPPPPTEEPKPTKAAKTKHPNKGGGNAGEGADPGNNPDKGNDDESK